MKNGDIVRCEANLSMYIAYISVSKPTHGQWPARMGSWRVLIIREDKLLAFLVLHRAIYYMLWNMASHCPVKVVKNRQLLQDVSAKFTEKSLRIYYMFHYLWFQSFFK